MDVISVGLSKYIDDSTERPVIRNTTLPVAAIAYRALSCSWDLSQLCYVFGLEDAEALAALLYYEQFRDRIDLLEDAEPELDAMD
ncbi:MAG: hypothetical protein OHK0046_32970 [Anaerolineae bacterium]